MRIGVEIEKSLEIGYGRNSSRLVEPRFGRTHKEALPHVVLCRLCIMAFGIGLTIFLEILRRRFIVLAAIFGHGQHIEALLRIFGSFFQGDEFLQKGYRACIFAFGETFFGVFVFVGDIIGFVHLIEFMCTGREQ